MSGTQTVGNGPGFSSQVSTTISWAEGSFPSVSGVTSDSSSEFSLQINSNQFSGTALCNGAADPSNCSGWEQFVYSPGVAFIQYWLLNYQNTCPPSWYPFEGSCFINGGGVAVPILDPTTDLAQVALIGTATSGGDSVALSVGGVIFTSAGDNLVNLSASWNTAEFNIFGNANGSEYSFNTGSSIVVQTLTDSTTPTTDAPTCFGGGFTGETNNLTLVSGSCCPIGGGLPGIQFTESNNSSQGAQACPLDPVDPNWSTVDYPFDAILTGVDGDGAKLFSCRANVGGGVHPGKIRSGWSACDIGYGGQEIKVQPYETLVAGWTDEVGGAVPYDARSFGTDGAGGPDLYPCRAYLDGDGYQLGKVRPGLGACFIPYAGQEVAVARYQVLTNAIPTFAQNSTGAHPNAGIVGGYDSDGTPLYVCQAAFGGGLVPGKARADLKSCVVAWGGGEHYVSDYSVLAENVDPPPPGRIFPAGNESDGTVLGICRAHYQNSWQVGKYVSNGACNFGFGGAEVSVTSNYFVIAF